MSIESLINKYRPTSFKEVFGHTSVVKSFKNALDDRTSHAFLFTGPSGVGKTTLARIGANYIGSEKGSILEIDGATHNSVEDMRTLTESLRYRPLGKSKSIIIDEAHAISAQAWRASLKMVEEPPEWVYWFFCTTDPKRVPATISSRCVVYDLPAFRISDILDFLVDITFKEKLDTPNTIIELCAKNSLGSPRKALSLLSAVYNKTTRANAALIIAKQEFEEGGTAFELARALKDGWSWKRIQPLLKAVAEDENITPESVRHTIRTYFTTVILNSTEEKVVCQALRILDNFVTPSDPANGFSEIAVAVGRSVFSTV